GASYACGRLCDIVHAEGARVLATYGEDFYAGTPVLTENQFGDGRAYYVASDPEERFLDDFYAQLLAARKIAPPLRAPAGVEVALRQTDRHSLLYILNHQATPATVALPAGQPYDDLLRGGTAADTLALGPYDVCILRQAF